MVAFETTRDALRLDVRRYTRNQWYAAAQALREATKAAAADVPDVESLTFERADLRRDTDGDGWTDILEKWLATDPDLADTDGDTLDDSRDGTPRGVGPEPAGPCAARDVFVAAFAAKFGIGYYGDEVPLFGVLPEALHFQYSAPRAPVILLTPDEAAERAAEPGWSEVVDFWFESDESDAPFRRPHVVGEDGIVFSDEGRKAVVHPAYRCSEACGNAHRVVLRCIDGRWYPVEVHLTWVS